MSGGPTYRLVVIRLDGTREPIAGGIPEARATALRQFLESGELASKLAIEPERKPDGPSGPGPA
jgi:hypothetical protein